MPQGVRMISQTASDNDLSEIAFKIQKVSLKECIWKGHDNLVT